MKAYLVSILAAAIISGIITKLMDGKGTQGTVAKLIAGLFLSFAIISPLKNIRIEGLSVLTESFESDAQLAVENGQSLTSTAIGQRIKQSCEAYILDKARQLDADLEVSVTLDDSSVPVPVAVVLKGNVSPNTKRTLEAIIADNLGIPKEAHTWT